jgi:hypothetical protein
VILCGHPGRPRGGEALDWCYRSNVRSTNAVAARRALPQSLPRSTLRVSQCKYPEGNEIATGTVTRFNDDQGFGFITPG